MLNPSFSPCLNQIISIASFPLSCSVKLYHLELITLEKGLGGHLMQIGRAAAGHQGNTRLSSSFTKSCLVFARSPDSYPWLHQWLVSKGVGKKQE